MMNMPLAFTSTYGNAWSRVYSCVLVLTVKYWSCDYLGSEEVVDWSDILLGVSRLQYSEVVPWHCLSTV
jgi:hypothetical protein